LTAPTLAGQDIDRHVPLIRSVNPRAGRRLTGVIRASPVINQNHTRMRFTGKHPKRMVIALKADLSSP
jgi:hypothetical protein